MVINTAQGESQVALYNSDRRLKTDIAPLADALEGIQGLQGVTYRWADPASSQERQVGLIAQEVEDCYPEVVATDAKGFKSGVGACRILAASRWRARYRSPCPPGGR